MYKLSEDADYLAYGRHYAQGEYNEAIERLSKCLVRLREGNHRDDASFVLRCIGHIYLITGDKFNALRSFRIAECEAPTCLFATLSYIKFLVEELKDFELAACEVDRVTRAYRSGAMDENSRFVFKVDNLTAIERLGELARKQI
jgi:hypothetical protein